MNKVLKILLFAGLILAPIIFYQAFNQRNKQISLKSAKPQIALVFDDVGSSLIQLRQLYGLDIPLTVSIIPGLKYSRQISGLAPRYGFSVFVHLPLEPKKSEDYKFPIEQQPISSKMDSRQVKQMLNHYLDSVRNAIGVNNHMGSAASEDKRLMMVITKTVADRHLVYVDSRTSLASVACLAAGQVNAPCAVNEGFIDAVNDPAKIEAKIDFLVQKAKEKGKIIIIGHPRKNTLTALKKKIPSLKSEVEFITAKEYFAPH